MRKNIDDRFKIAKDGEFYNIESLIRDKVDDAFLLEIHTQISGSKHALESTLENIPKQIESLKNQMDTMIPAQIKSLDKKLDAIGPFVKDIRAKVEKEAAAKKDKETLHPTLGVKDEIKEAS